MPRPIEEGFTPWPEEAVREYVAAGYWEGKSLGQQLWESADAHLADTAAVDGEARLTFAELIDRADAAASRLRDLGLESGDRMVVQLPNSWEFVALTLACLRAGIVPVMTLPGHRSHELSYLSEHAEARAIAVPTELRGFDHQALALELAWAVESLEHVLVLGEHRADGVSDLAGLLRPADDPAAERARWDAEQPDSRSVAMFLLSGGTTGVPKLIPRTHDDYVYNAKGSAEVCGVDRQTVYMVALPASHNFPLACPGILGTLMKGGRTVMLPSPQPERAFATIAREGVTHTAVVPAVCQSWLEHHIANPSSDLDSLRVLQVGGARLADEVAARVGPVTGATLQQVFGMAEGLLNYTRLDDPIEVIVGTQGRPMCPDDEVLLVDGEDQPVPLGEPGSLLTRGPYTLRGYYRAEEHNARAFTADGWYRSGDICRMDAMANLIVEGRDKDMINRAGEKISAEEVENLIYRLTDVRQVAAVAMPDPKVGERVCVYVVPADGREPTLDDLREAMLAEGVAAYKLPEHVVIVPQLPETRVGKIDKKALREDISARLAAD